MTVIAAIAAANRVVMGCDTASSNDGTALYTRLGKIGRFRTADDELVLIGAAGNSAIIPTLRRHLTIEASPRGRGALAADRWAEDLAEAITGVLANANPPLLRPGDDSANSLDGIMLVAWRHCVWMVTTHTATRPHSGIAAIGSGRDLALGSMHTAIAFGVDQRTAVDHAVRCASHYDSGCRIDERGPMLRSTDDPEHAE
ncbi:hypothetical protein [Nocardia wallacei]|uniref:hypothetical protein n=1 Tax=Nocardia wallacei TaxID=480035 RepID=UPI0024568D55|nr:hypothetical protein [Nocardia wallacei]